MIFAQRLSAKVPWTLVVVICAAALALMFHSASGEPAIVDEAAHIPAGYGYVSRLDFRLNPEHPPLVKALAAAPLLFLRPNFPTDIPAWTQDVNGQWTMGEEFLYKSGNDASRIVAVSRIMPMLLTLLTILFVYFWSRKLMGGVWALLPTFLLAFSPTVLAHGHYVTTDIGAGFGVLLSTYFFIRYLREPSPQSIVIAGAALGVAELMKFSAVLLFPYFVILAIVHFLVNARSLRGKFFWKAALRKLGQLVLVFVAAFAVIYIVYALFTVNYPINKQVSDTRDILTSFAGGAPQVGESCGLLRCLAEADIWMAGNRVTRPAAEYLLGVLMVIQRSAGGNTAYFLGEVSKSGSHWYFPIVYLLKEPIPALIIVIVGFLGGLWGVLRAIFRRQAWLRFIAYLQNNFTEFALLVFLAIYWIYSVRSTLNIGVRHLIPVIPLMYMLAAGVWRRWVMPKIALGGPLLTTALGAVRSIAYSWLKLSLLTAILLWVLMETLAAAPHFLSYYNQFGGGTWNGYRYITDSNYDWGQDLVRLQEFIAEHPEIDRIAVDYFGTGGAPAYYLGDRKVDWWSARGNPADEGIRWLAISVNTLQSAIQPADYDLSLSRKPEDTYGWLTDLRPKEPGMGGIPAPEYRIGTSIFIYKLF